MPGRRVRTRRKAMAVVRERHGRAEKTAGDRKRRLSRNSNLALRLLAATKRLTATKRVHSCASGPHCENARALRTRARPCRHGALAILILFAPRMTPSGRQGERA
jgi:hypothetical protein